VESNTAPFNPAQFTDRYEEALLEVIKAKIAGSEPVVVQEVESGKIIDLMSALQQSLAQTKSQKSEKKPISEEEAKGPPAKKPRAESVRTIAQGQRKLKAG
jgi:DNA end-binding protein Ku